MNSCKPNATRVGCQKQSADLQPPFRRFLFSLLPSLLRRLAFECACLLFAVDVDLEERALRVERAMAELPQVMERG